jgi:RHS repeat-associated protein
MHTTANGNGAVYNLLDKPDSMVIANKATLYYYYDAAGTKLRKQVNDYTTGKTLNYLYIDGFVYLNDTLQYVNEEEGRIRWANDNGRLSFIYDYYLRDHLGNVRTVLTEEKDTAFYMPASLETANLATEKLYYSGEDSGRINKSGVTSYPTDNYTSPNDYIQQLSGSGFKIGTGIVLKVMAGDQFNIRVSSWYKKNGLTPATPISPLTALINALVNSVGSVTTATHGTTTTQLQNSGVIIPGANTFYNSHNTADSTTKPKAFINWVLLDDQFKYVASSSGFEQVGADQEFKIHVKNNMPVAKNGYLYVYVSNETPNINVYFDNLQVTHLKGPLLQEQSFYPFGLQMAGISDKALGKLDSKNKFNGGVTLEEDYGVNLYETPLRNYDSQIGKFTGVDALAEMVGNLTPYQYAANDPIDLNDPSGLIFVSPYQMLDPVVVQGKRHDYSYSQWEGLLDGLGIYETTESDGSSGGSGGYGSNQYHGGGGGGSSTGGSGSSNQYSGGGGNSNNVTLLIVLMQSHQFFGKKKHFHLLKK